MLRGTLTDLVSLRAQIFGDDPAAAKRVARHILHCIKELLPPHPQLNHPGRVPSTRELVIPKTPFIVPYRVHNEMLQILRVYPRQTSRVLHNRGADPT